LGALVLFLLYTFAQAQDSSRKINVTVDPRIELLAAVQVISNYNDLTGLITRHNIRYKQDMLDYFSPYKKEPAVAFFNQMARMGFTYDAPPAAMLYLSDPPKLKVVKPFSEHLISRAWGEENLIKFVEYLRDFAVKSDFMVFFNSHQDIYDQIIAEVESTMAGNDYIATLENYYGVRQNSYNIILVPVFHQGGFGPCVLCEDGSYDVYNICGSVGEEDGHPLFGSAEAFKYLAWHEFSHSFVNPVTDKFEKEVNEYASLFDPIAEKMAEQAYPGWRTCVYEHLVRAANVRFSYLEDGEKAGKRAMQHEKNRGFAYVEVIAERLMEYEDNRDRYPTLESFYPRIIDLFKELDEMELGDDFFMIPFTGTINAVFGNKKSITIILPTNESDKDAQDDIHNYVESLVKEIQNLQNAVIISDSEALKMDLANSSILVYGTFDGNQWLAEHLKDLPVKIKADEIIADKNYGGENLRFITAWPNPYNPSLGMVIYTAQKAEDITGINSIFHGPTDYVVASGNEALKSGNYDKDGEHWSF